MDDWDQSGSILNWAPDALPLTNRVHVRVLLPFFQKSAAQFWQHCHIYKRLPIGYFGRRSSGVLLH